ncbi:tRNA (uridine(34)/cytosine(34)/5-carboxymethylaminomethyluridine(34)-2'-O)-methyltransferase TrmL [Parasutterella secunda]|jgi:RNA methyltransferase, trmH family, group 2|uniref:tRNA (uridine(34)/cytosine(34)/5- carboxymethylaminomethyluridine(34)-2'-O)- methyltransferase TrmL n=1 Tax=Parasutterella secunda TaxID=626947 RepID=UPI001F96A68F|nr:tRNA (uridine(34)/cytosine(34)/5-carboxymethylaminomethyluridine(34)-2'-O)-methyltransferase TrmL [Parasutterella secunda]HIR22027.1 tRNA (uridine(34)/cytosine(34)/5-carboxymethylaminomethyluridine(34)-2'-O)-methyltransferase TrmL [Candidatus Aphodousia faecalis]MCR8920334.1 tRNA (uridine(34)/cytosine(34)/5-carboxymethylaminomethyluridine(34)-2'-O)-methyltransferase TrmL [Parasutterella secunda]MDM8087366.1 tRNA (uridine(34)/cytosine(34)/5-carboxymethylaminomethyluridine(34)-2'-O)-methyltrans
MFRIVLVAPEIPPNTGNIIRLSANTGCELHLVEPLGFTLEDKHMIRAGLDYHEYATVKVHKSFDAFLESEHPNRNRMFAMTTKGSHPFADSHFLPGDWFVFGSEGHGLPDNIRNSFPEQQRIRLPMRPHNRSLNLSNTVAITVYEAWRQNNYEGGL